MKHTSARDRRCEGSNTRMNQRRSWFGADALVVSSYAKYVVGGMSYYRACREIGTLLSEARTWESIRSRLKREVAAERRKVESA